MHYGTIKIAVRPAIAKWTKPDYYETRGVIWNYKEFECIIHHDWLVRENRFTTERRFTVSEKTTGLAIAQNWPTIHEAKLAAKRKLDDPILYERAKKYRAEMEVVKTEQTRKTSNSTL